MNNITEKIEPLVKGEYLVDGYTVIEHLRRGNDCDVYHLWSEERLCGCIGKTVQPGAREKDSTRYSLINEGQYLKKFSHPNLVRGYDLFTDPYPVIIQETLTGETLSHLIRRLKRTEEYLPLKQLAHFGLQLTSVVHYLHLNNLLHLDLKPSNIISQPPLAKLIDLSLAERPGAMRKGAGTPQYMSPEQARGDALTTAADIWGIGAVLFFAVTGERPFKSLDNGRYDQLERFAEPVDYYRKIDPIFANMIDRCLQYDPIKRPKLKEIDEFLRTFVEK